MDSILIKTLETIYKMFIGQDVYKIIVNMVTVLMNEDFTNDEKREKVKDKVAPLLNTIGEAFLSAIIAFVVSSLKNKIQQEKKK